MAVARTQMDPALRELTAQGSPNDQVGVVVRLRASNIPPPAGLRLVARFGAIATGRAARRDLAAIHDDPAVASLKAPRLYAGELDAGPDQPGVSEADPSPRDTDRRRPAALKETGRNTVVAVVDWGCDFAHPDFCRPDGGTRLLALWDQRAAGATPRYGYGRLHDRSEIDRALSASDPFHALGYHPGPPASHGSHVLGIAAGNGRAGGPSGIAPEAELFFCHLGPGIGELGNSIDLLEAIDCAVRVADRRPLALNLSIGRHAGPHDGSLLIEQAIDWLISSRPGTAVVQSTGNYYARDVHMAGRLQETRTDELPFRLDERDDSPVTVELWYKGADTFSAQVISPDGTRITAPRGQNAAIKGPGGEDYGTLYHRAFDPNNGDHLIALVLRPRAPSGIWRVRIAGIDVVDGRWHAWIERNAACPSCQAKFLPHRAVSSTTIGSICNAMRTITVGAYDAHSNDTPLAGFSSAGPTRDGRPKPLLVAPGKDILSVRSRSSVTDPPGYVRMSGTSMAAPHVTGTAALIMEATGRRPLSELRSHLFATLTPAPEGDLRWGYGLLDTQSAVERARRTVRLQQAHTSGPPAQMEDAMASEDLEADVEPPRDRLWTKGRDQTLPTAQQRVLGPMSETELEALLSDGPPLVAIAGRSPLNPGEALARAADPYDTGMSVVGWPGMRLLTAPQAGDMIVDQGPGRPARAFLVVDPAPPGAPAGRSVTVAHGDDGTRPLRIVAPDGLIQPGFTILRETAELEVDRPVIRNGSKGPAVSEAQTRLNSVHATRTAAGETGLDGCPLEVDGRFGAKTRAATISFQRIAFRETPSEWDGVIGRRTWKELLAASERPPAKAAVDIAIVLDDDNDHAVDGKSPVATAVMYGLWDQAFNPTGDVRDGAAEADSFVGADTRRFYLRVRDPGARTATVTAQWRTLHRDRSNDDAPTSQDITLVRISSTSDLYVSRAVMLVSDDIDAMQPTNSGLTSGPDTGSRRRGESNHRLRRAELDGFVFATYTPAGGTAANITLPVFSRKPEMRRRIDVRVVVYSKHANAAQVRSHFHRANLRWAQAGVRLVPAKPTDRTLPPAACDKHGRYTGSLDNPAEVAVMKDLLPVTPDNTITVVFVNMTVANAYATVLERTRSALGNRFFIFINPGVHLNNETLGHEFHHIVFNRPDVPQADANTIGFRRFFSFNTLPPVAYKLPLPDVRIYRRIHTLHAADPNNDPPNNCVINWPRRARTARFPTPNALDAPDATTGNTLAVTP